MGAVGVAEVNPKTGGLRYSVEKIKPVTFSASGNYRLRLPGPLEGLRRPC